MKVQTILKVKKLKSLKENFATYFNAKALTVNSGTDALIVGIKSLNLKKETRYLLPQTHGSSVQLN